MTARSAKQRFADSAGLAVAAIGWEARVELRRDHFKRAIGFISNNTPRDGSAVQSLRIAAYERSTQVATNLPRWPAPRTPAVITAYLISDRMIVDYPTGDAAVRPVEAWLSAVETAGIRIWNPPSGWRWRRRIGRRV